MTICSHRDSASGAVHSARSFAALTAAILAIAVSSSIAKAQQTRQWTSDDGRFKVEAALVSFDGQIAMLKKLDGVTIKVPLTRLSQSDREYLETLHAQVRVKPQDKAAVDVTQFVYPGGRFLKEGCVWREFCNPDPTFAFYFREIKRDSAWLYLRDDSRGYDVRIPLSGGQSYLQHYLANTDNWNPLHMVQPAEHSSEAQPAPTEARAAAASKSNASTIRFEHPNGQFVKNEMIWIEYGSGDVRMNSYRETGRDDKWIYAHDDAHALKARFPVNGGAVYLQPDDCHPDIWKPYLTVKPAADNSAAAP